MIQKFTVEFGLVHDYVCILYGVKKVAHNVNKLWFIAQVCPRFTMNPNSFLFNFFFRVQVSVKPSFYRS